MMRTLIAVAALVACSANADVTLDQINNNEVADATVVMGNFNALNGAIPLVWSNIDGDLGGTTIIEDDSMREINSLKLTAAAQGVLVVSGGVYVNHVRGEEGFYILDVLIDGQSVFPDPNWPNWVTGAGVPGRNAGYASNLTNIAYTITVPVAAGAHNVQQKLGPYDLGNGSSVHYFYNKNFLTVQYYPESQASLKRSPDTRSETVPANPIGEY
jgi:hypothetical protein